MFLMLIFPQYNKSRESILSEAWYSCDGGDFWVNQDKSGSIGLQK